MSSGASKSVLIILHVEEGGVPLSGEDFSNLPGHAKLVSFANLPSSPEIVKSVFYGIKGILHALELNHQLLEINHNILGINGIDNNCTAILPKENTPCF